MVELIKRQVQYYRSLSAIEWLIVVCWYCYLGELIFNQ